MEEQSHALFEQVKVQLHAGGGSQVDKCCLLGNVVLGKWFVSTSNHVVLRAVAMLPLHLPASA